MSRHRLHSEARSGELFLQLSRLPAGLRCGWGRLCHPAAGQAGPLQVTSSGVSWGFTVCLTSVTFPGSPGWCVERAEDVAFPSVSLFYR